MPRPNLTRDRVLAAALEIADAGGLPALTMRSLAQALGVQAMSLYHHVANKEAVLDGLVDGVFGEIEDPDPTAEDWRAEITRRCHSARAVLRRHPWALPLMESRTTPAPQILRHHEATLATLRRGGFDVLATAHAYALLDSYVYGFAVQEAALPFVVDGSDSEAVSDVVTTLLEDAADAFPYLTEMASEHVLKPGYAFADEFAVGLGIVLDGLERLKGAR